MHLLHVCVAAVLTSVSCVLADKTSKASTFDVVVIGSGPGGLIAAEFLSRDPSIRVLVLEAGGPSLQATGGTDVPPYATSKRWTKFDIPGEYNGMGSIFTSENIKYTTDYTDDRKLHLGQLVGGSSSLNAALYFRVPDAYLTQTQWPFTSHHVNQRFDEMEQEVYSTTDTPSPDGKRYLQEAFTIAKRALLHHGGYRQPSSSLNDVVARNQKHKTLGFPPFAIKNGLRDSPAKTCWGKMTNRSNVVLRMNARVHYIKQANGKAVGVVYGDNQQVLVRGSVIMAAGAIGTPKVLIQSGIGPKNQLEGLLTQPSTKFPGVHQSAGRWVINENVGKHLFDTTLVLATFTHPEMKSFRGQDRPKAVIDQYINDQSGPLSMSGPVLIGYENYRIQNRLYEFQTTILPHGVMNTANHPQAFTAALYINNPESRDTSSFDPVTGRYRAFTDNTLYMSTTNDLLAMQDFTAKIVQRFEAEGATLVSKASSQSLNEFVSDSRGLITNHFGGSCYISKDKKDTNRCADQQMRVVGTSNIYIADGSGMRDGTVNPYGYIMYMGREVGHVVQAALARGKKDTSTNIQCSNVEQDTDYIGGDVGKAPATSADLCCALCQNTSRCGAYTWTNYEGGMCWLKDGKREISQMTGAVSGTVQATHHHNRRRGRQHTLKAHNTTRNEGEDKEQDMRVRVHFKFHHYHLGRWSGHQANE